MNANECSDPSKTVQIVQGCPITQVAWEEAAARKNCGDVPNSCSPLFYHCIMNTWQNETVEVCAPRHFVVGNCKKKCVYQMNLNNFCYLNNHE